MNARWTICLLVFIAISSAESSEPPFPRFEEATNIELIYSPAIPEALGYYTAINEEGYLVTWGLSAGADYDGPSGFGTGISSHPTLPGMKVFAPDGTVKDYWMPEEGSVASVIPGKGFFHVATTTYNPKRIQWYKYQLDTGKVEKGPLKDSRSFFVCDGDFWVEYRNFGLFLWTGGEIGTDTDVGKSEAHWERADDGCHVAINLSEVVIVLIVGPDGKIVVRYDLSKKDTPPISGDSYDVVFPFGSKWLTAPGLKLLDPEHPGGPARTMPGLKGRPAEVVIGENWIAYPEEKAWRVCGHDLACRRMADPQIEEGIGISEMYRAYRAIEGGNFCITPELLLNSWTPRIPSQMVCLNPERGVVRRYGWPLGPGDVSDLQLAAPLGESMLLVGRPWQTFDLTTKRGNYISPPGPPWEFRFSGSYGRYAVSSGHYGWTGDGTITSRPAAGVLSEKGVAWVGQFPDAPLESHYELLGALSTGQAVLIRRAIKLQEGKPVTEPDRLELRFIPGTEPGFLRPVPQSTILALKEFHPALLRGNYGAFQRSYESPFIDSLGRLWLVERRTIEADQSPDGYRGTNTEVRVYQLPSGREVLRHSFWRRFRDPGTTASKDPSEEPKVYGCAYFWCLRWIPGTNNVLMQRGHLLIVAAMERDSSEAFDCSEFCEDVLEWYPQGPKEWLAEKPDGLYRVTLK